MARSRAFTLVELLAVLAIVAVLALLIVAVTGEVRQAGNTTKCASNLRQVGMAVQTYAADNKGRIVASRTRPGSAIYYWPGLLAPYLGVTSVSIGFPNTPEGSPYMCPEEKANGSDATEYALAIGGGFTYQVRYLINLHITARPESPNTGFTNQATYRECRMAEMASPSRTMLFLDGFGNMGIGYWAVNPSMVTYPHNEHVNVLYVDGHVEQKTSAQMTYYASKPYHVFWRGYDWGLGGYLEN